MPLNEDVKVGLLIGLNCSHAIKPLEVISGPDDPYAKKKLLSDGESLVLSDRQRKKMLKLGVTLHGIV